MAALRCRVGHGSAPALQWWATLRTGGGVPKPASHGCEPNQSNRLVGDLRKAAGRRSGSSLSGREPQGRAAQGPPKKLPADGNIIRRHQRTSAACRALLVLGGPGFRPSPVRFPSGFPAALTLYRQIPKPAPRAHHQASSFSSSRLLRAFVIPFSFDASVCGALVFQFANISRQVPRVFLIFKG